MPNKIIKSDKGVVSVRIDNAYTTNEKHLVLPYTDEATGKERYFGSFKFLNANEAKETLKEAIKQLGKVEDTVFAGQYPKWITDAYGTQLKVSGRVKFFKEVNSTEEVPQLNIRNFIYSLELHLTPTKDGKIYLKVARAIVDRPADEKYTDELFAGKPKAAAKAEVKAEIADEELPF